MNASPGNHATLPAARHRNAAPTVSTSPCVPRSCNPMLFSSPWNGHVYSIVQQPHNQARHILPHAHRTHQQKPACSERRLTGMPVLPTPSPHQGHTQGQALLPSCLTHLHCTSWMSKQPSGARSTHPTTAVQCCRAQLGSCCPGVCPPESARAIPFPHPSTQAGAGACWGDARPWCHETLGCLLPVPPQQVHRQDTPCRSCREAGSKAGLACQQPLRTPEEPDASKQIAGARPATPGVLGTAWCAAARASRSTPGQSCVATTTGLYR